MKESKAIEYKETITNTFLKTVSAYANYGTGIIVFGIDDAGNVIGVSEPEKQCLDIENRINDSISPVPNYNLSIDYKTSVITLQIKEGIYKPYFYKSKAYRRNDTASIEVDRIELTRLILEGQNTSYEELPAQNQLLQFSILEQELKKILKIDDFSKDTLTTLELYSADKGFNKAAELLADNNKYCGIDIVRFGDTNDIFLDRETIEHESIIAQYHQSLIMFKKYYQYEQIKGFVRETHALIPENAFREAIANALVHRTWDIPTHVNVAMFKDRIEITSPGGLPKGISKNTYLNGGLSILRNRILGTVFFRLHFIEKFGTGITRISEAYKESKAKPNFIIDENSIKVILPIFTANISLSEDELVVYNLLKSRSMPSSTIVQASGFGKSKALHILKALVDGGYVKITGNGRGTKYSLI